MVSGLRLYLQKNSGCHNALTVLCVFCWNVVYVFSTEISCGKLKVLGSYVILRKIWELIESSKSLQSMVGFSLLIFPNSIIVRALTQDPFPFYEVISIHISHLLSENSSYSITGFCGPGLSELFHGKTI